MKKGQKIIGISAIILAISVVSIACQKKTETKEVVANETRTTLEYVETIETEETETEKNETEDKKKETKTTDKKSDSHKKETEGKEISKKESETKPQKPSKPTETQPQKPSKPAETQPQKPTRPTETQPQKPSKPAETQHSHNWLEVTEQVYHEAEGHYKTEVIQEAWDEPIYESHNFCNDCQADLGDAYNAGIHLLETGHNSYYAKRVQVGTQHHDAVTEKKWVEDKAAWTETVVVGYKCSSCGETKKK